VLIRTKEEPAVLPFRVILAVSTIDSFWGYSIVKEGVEITGVVTIELEVEIGVGVGIPVMIF